MWLYPETSEFGLASPSHLHGASAMVAIMVDDVDAHHRDAVEHGATIRYEPVDRLYGYREYGAIDPEGPLWSFMKALARGRREGRPMPPAPTSRERKPGRVSRSAG